MNRKRTPNLTVKKEISIVRSSAAEYLTFVAAGGKGGVEAVYADENIWLIQKRCFPIVSCRRNQLFEIFE
jgi:hypothetical protein